jgi:hypothetical protein
MAMIRRQERPARVENESKLLIQADKLTEMIMLNVPAKYVVLTTNDVTSLYKVSQLIQRILIIIIIIIRDENYIQRVRSGR